MLNALIQHNGENLVVEIPCRRMQLSEQLQSIGIKSPAHEIMCTDDDGEDIKVKIYGSGEFENKLASLISSDDTLSVVNTVCELYELLPYQNKLASMQTILSGSISNFNEFGKRMLEERMQDVTVRFYCPLIANIRIRNEYGDLEEDPYEYDGSYLVPHEEKIREMIREKDADDIENLAESFRGSNGVSSKLKEIHFSTQNVSGVIYGCIRAELSAPLSPDEENELREWLVSQCADGYGEGLEQREIQIEDGEMYVSYWNSDDTYFMLNQEEFDNFLISQRMGGVE